jgi:tetratricopeptide (TPR) repeat protein
MILRLLCIKTELVYTETFFSIRLIHIYLKIDCFNVIGDNVNTMKDLEKALSLTPDDVEIRAMLGYLRLRLGQSYVAKSLYADAISEFSEALQVDPDRASRYLFERGRAHLLGEEIHEARADLEASTKLDNSNGEAVAMLSQLQGGPHLDSLQPFPKQKLVFKKPNRGKERVNFSNQLSISNFQHDQFVTLQQNVIENEDVGIMDSKLVSEIEKDELPLLPEPNPTVKVHEIKFPH